MTTFWVLEPPSYYRSGVAFYDDLSLRMQLGYTESQAQSAAFNAWNRLKGMQSVDLRTLMTTVPYPLVFLMPQAECLVCFGAYANSLARKKKQQPPATRKDMNELFSLGNTENASLGGRIDFPKSFFVHHLELVELMNAVKRFLAKNTNLDAHERQGLEIYTSPSKLLASVELLSQAKTFEGAAHFYRQVVAMPKQVAEQLERGEWEQVKFRFRP